MPKTSKAKSYLKIDNLFSPDEVDTLTNLVKHPNGEKVQELYGRMRYFGPFKPIDTAVDFEARLTDRVNKLLKTNFPPCKMTMCVVYNSAYGEPNLPPHFDGDSSDLILNYQLESNTDWPVGIGTELIELTDNSALIFNPNTNIHWRPEKQFRKNEFVKMVFFRFESSESKDYSHLNISRNDPIFEEVDRFRLGL